MERVHATITGRVQGVGFRYFVNEQALALGVLGWVRNRYDHSVELVAEAERPVLDQFLLLVERGPRSSYVSQLTAEWLPASGEFADFRIRSTV